MRKLLGYAFSDGALLEQEPLLAHYFDLLISRLKEKVDGPAAGVVDMMAYYNFTTFDIIGYPSLRNSFRWFESKCHRDLVLGESFGALEGDEYPSWIRSVLLVLAERC